MSRRDLHGDICRVSVYAAVMPCFCLIYPLISSSIPTKFVSTGLYFTISYGTYCKPAFSGDFHFRTTIDITIRPNQRQKIKQCSNKSPLVSISTWQNNDTCIPMIREPSIIHKIIVMRQKNSILFESIGHYVFIRMAVKADFPYIFYIPSEFSEKFSCSLSKAFIYKKS